MGLAIVGREKDYSIISNDPSSSDTTDTSVIIVLSAAVFANLILLTSISLRHYLYFKWLQAKKFITQYDTLGNTGLWKPLIIEIVLNLIMPYPFINDYTYYEVYASKDGDVSVEFRFNSILLCLMTFIRLY
jgi:hypothetical protein